MDFDALESLTELKEGKIGAICCLRPTNPTGNVLTDGEMARLGAYPLKIHKPEGAIFLWLWFENLPVSSQTLYEMLKAEGTLIIPGEHFFVDIDTQDYPHAHECIRMSIAQDAETLEKGIAAIGTMLALTGVMLQRLTQNPMAGPELLGISSGTAFGAMASVMLFGITSGSGWFWLVGVISALASLGLLMLFNRKNGLAPEKVLLTGMAIAALADAAIRIWTASGDYRVQQLLVWMSGSTYQATPESALTVSLLAAASLLLILPLQRWLGLLSLNADVAQSTGVNVSLARMVLIASSAALTAAATLLIGPLSFVGLLAPHLARMLGARLPGQQLAAAALIGASVMMTADWLGRQVMFPYEVPAGMMATLIGGAYFMMMMRKL